MIIGLIGDLHLNNNPPRKRLDNDYLETQLAKMDQAFGVFTDNKCDIVLQPGDWFDTQTVAKKVISESIRQLIRSGYSEHVYAVWGQHDVNGHSEATVPNSPLTVLEAAQTLTVLGSEPVYPTGAYGRGHSDSTPHGAPVALYGAPFGLDIPVPVNKDDYNILVGHIMVGDQNMYPDQHITMSKRFLKNHPEYDMIFLGDYHYRFSATVGDRAIMNMGAIVRKTMAKMDQELEPACGVFNTETNHLEVYKLDCAPVEEVLDLTPDIVKSDNTKILAALVDKLNDSDTLLCDWKRTLIEVLDEMKANDGSRQWIDDTLEEVNA